MIIIKLQAIKYILFYLPQVIYLQDFADKLGLNIRYNSEIVSVAQEKDGSDSKAKIFILKDRNDTLYRCEIMITRYCLYKECLTVPLFCFVCQIYIVLECGFQIFLKSFQG